MLSPSDPAGWKRYIEHEMELLLVLKSDRAVPEASKEVTVRNDSLNRRDQVPESLSFTFLLSKAPPCSRAGLFFRQDLPIAAYQ